MATPSADAGAELRQRKPAEASTSSPADSTKKAATTTTTESSGSGFSVLDVLRVAAGILLFSSALSYLVFNGESLTWGYNAWWTRRDEWQNLLTPAVSLTDAELAKYDGSDPTLPIYLALNGTIYDVSSSPTTYGPGGSYHFFAGRDAARAFLTGCFKDDQTPDLRGVEVMYLPLEPWDAEPLPATASAEERAARDESIKKARAARSQMSKQELKERADKELAEAREKVKAGLEHWHVLFRGGRGKKYREVGSVKREKGWLGKTPKRELCEQARTARPTRKY